MEDDKEIDVDTLGFDKKEVEGIEDGN